MTVIFAVFIVGIVCNRVAAQSSSQQTPQKSASGQSATLTPQETEAQKHYRIALEAIKNNDFTTASDELKTAADLAPRNALIWYNLAVVESKKGDSKPALDHLHKATSLGLPRTLQNDADVLEAKLSYEVRQVMGSSGSEAAVQTPQKDEANPCDIKQGRKGLKVGQIGEWGDLKILLKTAPIVGTTTSGQEPAIISVKAPGFSKRDVTIPQVSSASLQICGQSVTITFEGSYSGDFNWNFGVTIF
jgi:hypothetical protein